MSGVKPRATIPAVLGWYHITFGLYMTRSYSEGLSRSASDDVLRSATDRLYTGTPSEQSHTSYSNNCDGSSHDHLALREDEV